MIANILIKFILITSLSTLLLIIYSYTLNLLYEKPENIGMFGDSFGGLTSLFTICAFIALILALRTQQLELNATRSELTIARNTFDEQTKIMNKQLKVMESRETQIANQEIENSFFKSLELLTTARNNTVYSDKAGSWVFNAFYNAFCQDWKRKVFGHNGKNENSTIHERDKISKEIFKEKERKIQISASPYVETLITISELIVDTPKENILFKILSSQISEQELMYITLNSLIKENGAINNENILSLRKYHSYSEFDSHLLEYCKELQ